MDKLKLTAVVLGESKLAEQILKPFSKEMNGEYVRAVETKDLG